MPDRRTAPSIIAAAMVVLASLFFACGKEPTRPSSAASAPARLEIVAPRSLAPGATAQLTTTVVYSDGTRRDQTASVAWNSSNAFVLAVSPTGVATANQYVRGESYVTAAFNGLTSTTEIIVVDAGSYRLLGRVLEGSTPIPYAAVTVEETEGPARQFVTPTDAEGHFRIYGVAGNTRLRITQTGYQPEFERLTISDHQSLDVRMTPAAPRGDVAGRYTLTITASAACREALPEAVRQRTYSAIVEQTGGNRDRLDVALSGAAFVIGPGLRGNHFTGEALPDGRISFEMTAGDSSYRYGYNYPEVAEQLSGSYLIIGGTVGARWSDGRIAGTLNGEMSIWKTLYSAPVSEARLAICQAPDHQFVLTPVS